MPPPTPPPLALTSAFCLMLVFLFLSPLICFSSSEQAAAVAAAPTVEINLDNPVRRFIPSQHVGYPSNHGSEDSVSCERVHVIGLSRINISNYTNSFHVTVTTDGVLEKHHSKVEICFHRNVSLGLCECKKDEWKNLQKGEWVAVTSPYGDRYLDIKSDTRISGSIVVSITKEFHQWRLLALAIGFTLLLLAPVVSSWVPFYYSSSMALGILLIILIILFQGMKLIPTGRKSFLYLTIYGSILGAGSFLVHYFSMVVNSILANFGLSEEMHNPVYIFLLAGITLAGAAMGYWVVRKFVLLEDGTVDTSIAQFVKWAMRIFGFVFIFQSTMDPILAFVALIISWRLCALITSMIQRLRQVGKRNPGHANIWQLKTRQVLGNHRRAEFLSRSPTTGSGKPPLRSRNSPYALTDTPTKALVCSAPSSNRRASQVVDYYSTFHRTPTRKKFSKKEWDNFTAESTRESLAELCSTPEFADWVVENASSLQRRPKEDSDDSLDSSSDSSEETFVESDSEPGGFLTRLISH